MKSGSERQLIRIGEMNGRTGRKTGDTVVGNFGNDRVNDNGERLNYVHKHHWKYGMGFLIIKIYGSNIQKIWELLDFITTKQDLKLKIQDVRAHRGPNCGTDHKLLVAKILFPHMYITKDKHKEKKENTVTMVDKKRKYNTESLQNESTKFLYQQTK